MAYAIYSDHKATVGDWLTRKDLDQQIDTATLMAISTLNKIVRSSHMATNADIAIGAGVRKGACPADMLEPIYVQVKTDEDYPLEHVSVEKLNQLRTSLLRAQGTPRFYAIVGTNIEVTATPSNSTTLDMAYYQRIPNLVADGDTNWLMTYEPDLLLYTTLLYLTSFIDDANLTQLFSNMLTRQIVAAVDQNTKITMDSNGSATLAAVQPAQ